MHFNNKRHRLHENAHVSCALHKEFHSGIIERELEELQKFHSNRTNRVSGIFMDQVRVRVRNFGRSLSRIFFKSHS